MFQPDPTIAHTTPGPADMTHAFDGIAKSASKGDAAGAIKAVSSLGSQVLDKVIEYGPRVAGAFLLLFVAYVLAGWAQRATTKGLVRAHFDATLGKFFANTIRWMIIAFSLLMSLSVFGVDTTSYAALIGAAGLAIGLGLQGSLANLAAGVMLLVFRPFKVGDAIVVAGQSGVVDGIDLFTTSIDTADNRRIIIPNGAIFGTTIENTTHHSTRRTDITVVVAGNHNLEQTRRTLTDAIRGIEGALPTPAPAVVLADLSAGGGPNWRIEVWAKAGELSGVRERTMIAVRGALINAEIGGPVPSMNIIMPANK